MSFLSDIENYIRSGETTDRKLGLEIEHFIVNDNGDQIPFDIISPLILEVGNKIGAKIQYIDGYPVGYYSGEYSTSLEPSCQFEISIDPYDDLDKIAEIYKDFRKLWDPVFEKLGYRFITKGNLPNVELGIITPDDIPLSPKKRYKYMNEYFETSGLYGKYMMRASASAQVSIDYSSEDDMKKKLLILQKISPILMIIMENKTCDLMTLAEAPDKPHLLRIQEWDDIDDSRTGFVPHSFEDQFGYSQLADVIYNTPLILLSDNGETTEVGDKTARDLVEENVIRTDIDADRRQKIIEHVISMGFFHFRVKKYIEIRVADSVPIEKALGYTALLKGLMYSDNALDILVSDLASVTTADQIRDAIETIEQYGFEAEIYGGRTAEEWADHLISIAADNLSGKDKEYLKNVRTFGDHSKKSILCQ